MRLSLSTLFLSLTPNALPQDVLVPSGASWSYLDDGSDQGTAWRATGFDDSIWARGPAQLGYGEGDEATVVSWGPNAQNKYVTTYLRHEFVVANPGQYTMLDLRLLRDDGAIVYLNGTEIERSGLPSGLVTHRTLASETASEVGELVFRPTVHPSNLLVSGTNVLAVEVHQAARNSNDLSFDLELIGTDAALLRHGPYLQSVGQDRAVVRWRTSTPVVGEVRYGAAPNALHATVTESASVTEHEVVLTRLTPLTDFYYAVGDTSGATLAGGDEAHRFRTSTALGARMPLRAWLLGDQGSATEEALRVRDAFAAYSSQRPPDVLLTVGDNAYAGGSDLEYHWALFQTFAEVLRGTPIWPAIGNHEHDLAVYEDLFSLPAQGEAGGLPSSSERYYSFDRANVHFICLDSYSTSRSVGGPMWSWCSDDLAATNQDWIVAYFHHPPYSRGNHDSDNGSRMTEMRENFGPLLEANGVALVVGGHSHAYERSFLIDGHYDDAATFDAGTMLLDGGDGRIGGDGPYERVPGPRGGTVYVVAGSSGSVEPGPFDHPTTRVALAELGSLVIDVHGGRMDVRFLNDQQIVRDEFTLLDSSWDGSYCLGSIDGQGCTASVTSTGLPSLSSGQPYVLQAHGLRTQSFGLLFYGFGAVDGGPLLGGRFCVNAPFTRTNPVFSGGGAPCTGTLDFDFASIWTDPQHPGLVPGATIACQFWHRDTTSFGSSVTEALSFVIQP